VYAGGHHYARLTHDHYARLTHDHYARLTHDHYARLTHDHYARLTRSLRPSHTGSTGSGSGSSSASSRSRRCGSSSRSSYTIIMLVSRDNSARLTRSYTTNTPVLHTIITIVSHDHYARLTQDQLDRVRGSARNHRALGVADRGQGLEAVAPEPTHLRAPYCPRVWPPSPPLPSGQGPVQQFQRCVPEARSRF